MRILGVNLSNNGSNLAPLRASIQNEFIPDDWKWPVSSNVFITLSNNGNDAWNIFISWIWIKLIANQKNDLKYYLRCVKWKGYILGLILIGLSNISNAQTTLDKIYKMYARPHLDFCDVMFHSLKYFYILQMLKFIILKKEIV